MIGDKTATGDGRTTQDNDVGTTVGRIVERFSDLLRDGTDLVRLSVREEVQSASRKIASIAAAGIAAFIGLLMLANGTALWLTRFLGRAGGYVVTGLALLVIAGIVIFVIGRSGREKRG